MGLFSKDKSRPVKFAELHGSIAMLQNKKTLVAAEGLEMNWIEDNGLEIKQQGRSYLIPSTTVALVEFENANNKN